MKNVLVGIVVGVLGMYAYQRYQASLPLHEEAYELEPEVEAPVEKLSSRPSKPAFECDGRQHCSQMKSCEEAEFFLENCPDVKMDGDNDGVPCEGQYCGRH